MSDKRLVTMNVMVGLEAAGDASLDTIARAFQARVVLLPFFAGNLTGLKATTVQITALRIDKISEQDQAA